MNHHRYLSIGQLQHPIYNIKSLNVHITIRPPLSFKKTLTIYKCSNRDNVFQPHTGTRVKFHFERSAYSFLCIYESIWHIYSKRFQPTTNSIVFLFCFCAVFFENNFVMVFKMFVTFTKFGVLPFYIYIIYLYL